MSEWETISGPASDDGWETVPKKNAAPNTDPTEGMSGFDKLAAGAGKAFYDIGRGAGQIGRGILPGKASDFLGLPTDAAIAESRKLDAPLMNTGAGFAGNIAGNVAAALPAAFIPGANTAVGSALIGSGLGFVQPIVEGESRAKNAAVSGAFGLLGHNTGQLIGKGINSAGNKMRAIEQKVAAKAAADAASETASARSAAGTAAQNAYRQLEHLRDLNAMGLLSPDEKIIADQLSKELAGKAVEKLAPAAALKQATADAYKDALKTESGRASKLAADKLSNSEIKTQFMARLKRYGPAAVGGLVGNLIFPGLGGAVGGAATGLVLRPAIHSMRRFATNPAVQHKLLSSVANSGLLSDISDPRILGLLASSIYTAQE